MLIVGLTGGIATGKSTVSKTFTEHGVPIIDADILARQVVEPGQSAYNQIVAEFADSTPDLLLQDKQLNRPALGRRIFNDEVARKKLNAITHPAVRKAMIFATIKHWLSGHSMVVMDVPLLFEGGLDFFCGVNIVVACSDEEQLKRLLKRDSHLTKEDAASRIASQMPIEVKKGKADIVIENEGSIDDLKSKVVDVICQVTPNRALAVTEWLFPPLGLGMGFWVLLMKYLTKKQTKAKL